MTEEIIEHQYNKLLNKVRQIWCRYILIAILNKYKDEYEISIKQIKYLIRVIRHYVKNETQFFDIPIYLDILNQSDIDKLKLSLNNTIDKKEYAIVRIRNSILCYDYEFISIIKKTLELK